MASTPTPPLDTARNVVKRAQAAGKATGDATAEVIGPGHLALKSAADTIHRVLADSAVGPAVIEAVMAVLDPLLAEFFSALSAVRHSTTNNMGATMAELLNEFLGTALTESDVQPRPLVAGNINDESAATQARAAALGRAVLNQLEKEFTTTTDGSPSTGEKAAQTFAGYGVNFGIQNGIIALIGSLVPETRLDEVREMGVEVAQNLGLGRLMRVALRPLVQALVATPYQRQLNRRYQKELLPLADLLKAWHAERMNQQDVFELMRQHGLKDEFLTELTEQTRLRLKDAEWELLTALDKQPEDDQALADTADGMDSDWLAARLTTLTWARLRPVRDRVLNEAVSQVKNAFITIAQFQGVLDRLGIPHDEQLLWREAAGEFLEVPRKRPSLNEILFLYEAAQLTDDDLEYWIKAEGYYGPDVQIMMTYFRLKFIAATEGKSANTAAHAAAQHAEHVAYVTDEITGLWGRPPTPAELDYWVKLLDSAQRTKHDFTTELKNLDTKGAAMP